MKMLRLLFLIVVLLPLVLDGCTTINTFPQAARAGDSILLPAGRARDLTRQNITIVIAPSSGPSITYGASDPRIRAVVNLYPDPVSRLIVGSETGQGLGVNAADYGAVINSQITNQDKDWWQTLVYIDLPANLPTGVATVSISGRNGSITQNPIFIEILPGRGSSTRESLGGGLFDAANAENMLRSLERAEHYTVLFSGDTVPHSIQVELSHASAEGKPWVINPRGDIKNIAWSDDGSNLKVLLTPTHVKHWTRWPISNSTLRADSRN